MCKQEKICGFTYVRNRQLRRFLVYLHVHVTVFQYEIHVMHCNILYSKCNGLLAEKDKIFYCV